MDELAHWSAAGRVARFWLRDDDAVEPTKKLDDFLQLTGAFQVPVLLAVIPYPVKETLAVRLEHAGHVAPAVHGWGHINHAPPGEKSMELGAHRAQLLVLGELAAGLRKLNDLFGEILVPVLVPPWNRIDPNLLPQLPGIGYRAISAFGRKPSDGATDRLAVINTHVDVIDWRGTRGCRGHGDLIGEIASELAISRKDEDAAIGILTHHLVHDRGVAAFLEEFFTLIQSQRAAVWVRAADLIR
ncbi:MAG: polysaccharide deacetylase family protein [Fimbriimonadaceae bacterium]|nr:polysaccharide deacetylase family protein [Alphaproteobacteria bacterium]